MKVTIGDGEDERIFGMLIRDSEWRLGEDLRGLSLIELRKAVLWEYAREIAAVRTAKAGLIHAARAFLQNAPTAAAHNFIQRLLQLGLPVWIDPENAILFSDVARAMLASVEMKLISRLQKKLMELDQMLRPYHWAFLIHENFPERTFADSFPRDANSRKSEFTDSDWGWRGDRKSVECSNFVRTGTMSLQGNRVRLCSEFWDYEASSDLQKLVRIKESSIEVVGVMVRSDVWEALSKPWLFGLIWRAMTDSHLRVKMFTNSGIAIRFRIKQRLFLPPNPNPKGPGWISDRSLSEIAPGLDPEGSEWRCVLVPEKLLDERQQEVADGVVKLCGQGNPAKEGALVSYSRQQCLRALKFLASWRVARVINPTDEECSIVEESYVSETAKSFREVMYQWLPKSHSPRSHHCLPIYSKWQDFGKAVRTVHSYFLDIFPYLSGQPGYLFPKYEPRCDDPALVKRLKLANFFA